MKGFFEELGKKAAERWLGLLLLPGLLWLVSVLAAAHLHHRRPFDFAPALDAAARWADQPHTNVTAVVVLVALLLAAGAAGSVATGLAVVLRRLWSSPGTRPPARWLAGRRRRRWTRRHQIAARSAEADARDDTSATGPDAGTPVRVTLGVRTAHALARRDAISLELPVRPTWIGDRWESTSVRVRRVYDLDLTTAWPRLWAILPENLRTDITTAQTRYADASTVVAWALLYAVPAALFWPLAVVVLITLPIGVLRARSSTDVLCTLVETSVDLHAGDLAEHLTTPDPAVGRAITAQLRKEPPRIRPDRPPG